MLYLLSYWGRYINFFRFYVLPVFSDMSPAKRVMADKERAFGARSFPLQRETEERKKAIDAVAGMAGLEPTISESKSGVLPLHYIPLSLMNRGRQRQPR